MGVCGLCLTSNATDYIDINQNRNKKSKLSNIILTHLNLKIDCLEIVSKYICIDCYFRLHEFHKYCQKINQTQKLLRKTVYKAINPRQYENDTDTLSEQFSLSSVYNKDNHNCGRQFNASKMNIINTAMTKVKKKISSMPKEKLLQQKPCESGRVRKDFSNLQIAQLHADENPLQLYVLERLKSGNDVPMPKLTKKVTAQHSRMDISSIVAKIKNMEGNKDYFKCEHCLDAFKNNKTIKNHDPTCDNCPLHNFIFPSGMEKKHYMKHKLKADRSQLFKLY